MRTIRILLVLMVVLHLWEVLAILHVNDGVADVTRRFDGMRSITARLWIADAKVKISEMQKQIAANKMYE